MPVVEYQNHASDARSGGLAEKHWSLIDSWSVDMTQPSIYIAKAETRSIIIIIINSLERKMLIMSLALFSMQLLFFFFFSVTKRRFIVYGVLALFNNERLPSELSSTLARNRLNENLVSTVVCLSMAT